MQSNIDETCPSIYGRKQIYVDEAGLENWINSEIEKSGWTKGKLKCIKCQSNIGSFSFVAAQKCDCNLFNQPSVHFIWSKVDVFAPTVQNK